MSDIAMNERIGDEGPDFRADFPRKTFRGQQRAVVAGRNEGKIVQKSDVLLVRQQEFLARAHQHEYPDDRQYDRGYIEKRLGGFGHENSQQRRAAIGCPTVRRKSMPTETTLT